VLYADLAVRNASAYPLRGPLLVGVTRFSDPTVQLLAADGTSSDGIPYYDFSATLTNGLLNTGQLSGFRTLAFHNPNQIQFTYELLVLGQLNQTPCFTSIPKIEAVIGCPYAYDADATDPDGDSLTYSLVLGPAGMSVNPSTGLMAWSPGNNDLGSHDVVLRISDGRGGVAEQHYLLSVISTPANRPPMFVSTPITVAQVATNSPSYTYAANATDSDCNALTYSLLVAPDQHDDQSNHRVRPMESNCRPTRQPERDRACPGWSRRLQHSVFCCLRAYYRGHIGQSFQ